MAIVVLIQLTTQYCVDLCWIVMAGRTMCWLSETSVRADFCRINFRNTRLEIACFEDYCQMSSET